MRRRDDRAGALAGLLLTLGLATACMPSEDASESTAPEAGATSEAEEEEGDPARDAWVLPDEMGGIYAAQCAVCHGANQEGAAQGPALVGAPLPGGDSIAALVESISKGAPDKGMPAWRGVLPESEIRGLAIHLAELREGERSDESRGVGAAPTIPASPITTTHHALRIETVHGGLEEPYSIAPFPDGRILVTEKMRGLSVVSADGAERVAVEGTPRFYDDSVLRGVTYTGTGWAHEAALHPQFADNGWIYLSYGDRCEDCNEASRTADAPVTMLKLVRGRLDGARWVDQETVWEAPRETYVPGAENGAGARIAFDDAGHVFLTIGSLGDYAEVQNLDHPTGKTIRVRDDGAIPPDNPFLTTPGALPGVFTLGHRNAQGLDYDAATGRLWSSEHGPRGGDELNLLEGGKNYGWPLVSLGVDYDGHPIPYAKKYGIEFDPAALTPTVVDWTPSPGVSSIVTYTGDAFPAWRGDVLVATLAKQDLWRYRMGADGTQESETLVAGLGRFRDVEVAPDGSVLALIEHRAGSQIVRIVPAD